MLCTFFNLQGQTFFIVYLFSDFKESLQAIETAIKECDFIAIDGEFTGLNHEGLSPSATFDTPQERYHKLVQVI